MITYEMPKGLLAKGKDAFTKISASENVTNNEYFAVKEYCENIDEVDKYMKKIRSDGITMSINNDTNLIIHPLFKQVNELKKMNLQILKELGLTVKEREILGLGVEKEKTKLDEFFDLKDEVMKNEAKQ